VNVSAQAYVVSEIPAVVVGVFVNHHVVAVPIPSIGVGKVKRGDAEVEAAKPETAGIPTLNAPPMSATEATLKAAVLPRMVHMEAVVIPPEIVTNPFAVVVHVRGFRMAVAVLIRVAVVMVVIVTIVFMPVAAISLRAMVRNVSSTDVVMAVVAIVVIVFLGECRQRHEQCDRKHSGEQFHLRSLRGHTLPSLAPLVAGSRRSSPG
jgi:hypothetical protein